MTSVDLGTESPSVFYVAIIEDRHADTDVEVFVDRDAAIEWARTEVRDNLRRDEDLDEELTDDMRKSGWLYYGCYSVEGDRVRVVERQARQ